MKIICCNKEITEVEEGINDSDYYECPYCKKSYNVIESEVKE